MITGDRLGPYVIVGKLGEGGMGEVYRARDARLERAVAIKVLPISRHGDPSMRSRFEREAQALAALNHPNIAAIYDVIDVADQRAIVMELVMGSTLARQIASGPVPLRAAIGYGIDISDALSAAHAAGIVHRDLKPANIVVTENGSAKVLDFGIARRDSAGEDTATRETVTVLTGDHALVGTIGYMSPEQAHGRLVDGRSDIFSFGVLLYEAISGRPAFRADTAAGLLSAVLRDEPEPLRTIVPSITRALERCVMRCLEKDPRRRYQSAADLKIVLEDVRDDLAAPADTVQSAASSAGSRSFARRLRRPLLYAAAGLAVGAIGVVVANVPGSSAILTPRYRPFITEVTSAGTPSWSPNGRTLAYVDDGGGGERQIFVRDLESAQSTLLTKESPAGQPFWSPDGSRIFFVRISDGKLVSVGAGGGAPQVVEMNAAGAFRENDKTARLLGRAAIAPDGRTIVFARGQIGAVQLWTLDTRTGAVSSVLPAGMPQSFANVQALAFSPDDRTLAVVASTAALNQSKGLWLVAWPGGSARFLLGDAPYLASGFSIGWMPDGRRIVMSGSPLHGGASRLLMVDTTAGTVSPLTGGKDAETSPSLSADGSRIAFVSQSSGLDLIQFPIDGGPPEPLLATSRSESYLDMSASGLLAYVTDADGAPAVRLRLATDRWSRAITGGSTDVAGATPSGEVRLSPDGQRVAVGSYAAEHLIWIYPTAGGTPVRLDPESTDQHGPSWSPDGNWIAYRRMINGIWSIVKAPLGGGAIARLDDADPGGGATDWSPTGQWIAHARADGMHLISADAVSRRVLADLHSNAFRFSRDGSRLFAVTRGKNRRWELGIWDVESGRELREIVLPLAAAADLQWLALSPDGTRIIASAGANTSDIWLLEQFDPPSAPWARLLRW